MTISRTVYNQLFEHSDASSSTSTTTPTTTEHVIRLRPTEAKAGAVVVSAKNKIQMWTQEEHERFLVALEMFPAGPWKKVADYIGTKTPRQTMTHAQKYRQKISRRQRGLRNQKKSAATSSAPSSPKRVAIDTTSNNSNCGGLYSSTMQQPIQSPYGVADVYVKREGGGNKAFPMHGVAATHAAAAADPSAGRLDMLARAMAMQSDVKQQSSAFAAYGPSAGLDMTAAAVGPLPVHPRSLSPVASAVSSAASSPSNASLPSLAQILNLRGSGNTQTQSQQPTRPGCNCNCSCSPSAKAAPGCHTSPTRQ